MPIIVSVMRNLLNKLPKFFIPTIFILVVLIQSLIVPSRARAVITQPYLFGTLQSDPSHAATQVAAGITVVELGINWDQFEPQEGVLNQAYITQQKAKISSFKTAGAQIVLDLGIQYTPSWVLQYPNSYYVNQFGDQFRPTDSGKKIANMVFNQTLRDKQAKYMQSVFAQLGTDFYAVRLGGGWYGEVNYPDASYNGHTNAYWGYDLNALGALNNRPVTIPPMPNAQWVVGSNSTNHQEARNFIEWYLNSLKDYHDWQIHTVRQYYSGKLTMMYPSWGIRPGELESAIQNDLQGTTSPEINGEVQRGFDFARFVQGINDPNVIVYTTWIDSTYGDDANANPARWNPVHYLSNLAQTHNPPLQMWGENTGNGGNTQLTFSISQMKKFQLIGLMWAFEPQLYTSGFASLQQYKDLVVANQVIVQTPSTNPTPPVCREDINRDGSIDLSDYSLLVKDFLKSPPFNPNADINQNGVIDLLDYSLLVKKFLQSC